MVENSARLVRTVLLSSDVYLICVDLLVFHQLARKSVIFHSNLESLIVVPTGIAR